MADGGSVADVGFAPNSDTARAFRDALGMFATGVTLVTINGPTGPMGFVANSFSSLSIDPPLVMWAVARSARRAPHFVEARHFAVHVLALGQAALIRRFSSAGPGFDHSGFDGPEADSLAHDVNEQGVPLVAGALARFECEQHALHEGGDHLIVVGRVSRVVCKDGAPLVFAKGQMGQFASA